MISPWMNDRFTLRTLPFTSNADRSRSAYKIHNKHDSIMNGHYTLQVTHFFYFDILHHNLIAHLLSYRNFLIVHFV